MRIGLVCPYSWDVPGGVQYHVRDLAETLRALGHHVEVLTPAEHEENLPGEHVTWAGRAVPVPYNGSMASISFGPVAAARARRWRRAGDVDGVPVHEPAGVALSLLVGGIAGTGVAGGAASRARRVTAGAVAAVLLALTVVAFVFFWPIWTDGLLTNAEWQQRMWFRRWI